MIKFLKQFIAPQKQDDIIKNIPPELRFYKHEEKVFEDTFKNYSCVFGLPVKYDFRIIDKIPLGTKALYFYLGNDIENLLENVLETGIFETLEHLSIGYTRVNKIDFNSYNYSGVCKVLSKYNFPKLKSFEFGEDFLLANEHCRYGNLGNITKVLKNMPVLESLYLYGNFAIDEPLCFKKLERIEVLMNDWATNLNGGKISDSTICSLLSSEFNVLQLMDLDLNFNDEVYNYYLPSLFLTGKNTPRLKQFLGLSGKFISGTSIALRQSQMKWFKLLFY
ncbi:hypothetical protein CHU92_02025 [Flavobacterium cyanobacteriorum]|uniref:Leucine-rich repeat domain-containing protein n=1 Tax=Flavobacterium cyanobacteriorum TaxID=2022802 RepID=A0A255ZVG1_9FLAO|nr:hypothetical protein [Flavobacterium cyanobacteriorum]OYQ45379.1 hypothetical protein CHU92_02025 [Flavobacterium cyanobacteriorum]